MFRPIQGSGRFRIGPMEKIERKEKEKEEEEQKERFSKTAPGYAPEYDK